VLTAADGGLKLIEPFAGRQASMRDPGGAMLRKPHSTGVPAPGVPAGFARTGEDAELLRRVCAGELRAFEALYRSYHPRLTRFIRTVTQRSQIAEEVLNDTMLAVWTKPQAYNGASKVSTWIFAIAYRKTLKALRKWDEPVADDFLDLRPSPEPGPEQQVSGREVGEGLARALGQLSADHRTVISLACFDAFNYREVAEIMACPVETVKTRMFYARRHLRKSLAAHLDADA
jgi:RNA polymerase sigma-70 factor (ECF subfamily)